jgi:BON domain-containing protein
MPFPFRALLVSGAVAVVPVASAKAQTAEPQPPTIEQGPGLTPMDQGTSADDVKITQAIRQALTSTQGLSVDARNVKIITRDGNVTLRGQVRDQAERDKVVAAAKRTAGVKSVDETLQTQPMGRAEGSDAIGGGASGPGMPMNSGATMPDGTDLGGASGGH